MLICDQSVSLMGRERHEVHQGPLEPFSIQILQQPVQLLHLKGREQTGFWISPSPNSYDCIRKWPWGIEKYLTCLPSLVVNSLEQLWGMLSAHMWNWERVLLRILISHDDTRSKIIIDTAVKKYLWFREAGIFWISGCQSSSSDIDLRSQQSLGAWTYHKCVVPPLFIPHILVILGGAVKSLLSDHKSLFCNM